jgi:Glutathione S-transferase, N-terminal domain
MDARSLAFHLASFVPGSAVQCEFHASLRPKRCCSPNVLMTGTPPPPSRLPSSPQSNSNPQQPAVKRGLRLLEAPGSAFGALVNIARFGWNAAWYVMMVELAPSSASGDYVRPPSAFLSSAAPDSSKRDSAAVEIETRATLFYGVACQWCHRCLVARALLGLEQRLDIVELVPGQDGLWVISSDGDRARWGYRLKNVYRSLAPNYRGRFTAPLLVSAYVDPGDSNAEIVSNESGDILSLLPAAFGLADAPCSLAGKQGAHVWLRPR